jgi:TonB family protein
MTGRFRGLLGAGLLALVLGGGGCGRADIEPPVLQDDTPIPYPEALWDEGVEGVTTLRVRVTSTGEVDAVQVQESSGHEGLDAAAESGAWALRFEPGKRAGKRVRTWASIPVEFARRPAQRQEPMP